MLLYWIINIAIYISVFGIVVWCLRWFINKVNSIDKNLKEINEKLDKKE